MTMEEERRVRREVQKRTRKTSEMGANIWSNYHVRTLNVSNKMRYRIIKSMHIGIELHYDHRRACDRDAT